LDPELSAPRPVRPSSSTREIALLSCTLLARARRRGAISVSFTESFEEGTSASQKRAETARLAAAAAAVAGGGGGG